MSTLRLTATIGMVALSFALAIRADQDSKASARKNTQEIGSDFGGILAQDQDIPDARSSELANLEIADQETKIEVVAPAGPSEMRKAGIRDVVAPAGLLLLGTALTSFAFFTRRQRRHSRRAYYSRHSFVGLQPSKTVTLQTSRSPDSSEPNPSENTVRSSPRRRLA